MFSSFGGLIAGIENSGRLKRIAQPVSCELVAAETALDNPETALLFENPEGSLFPLALNTFFSRETVLRSIGIDNTAETEDRLSFLLDDKEHACEPEQTSAPSFFYGNFDNLMRLPALKYYQFDIGRALTLACVITKRSTQNTGLYRIQMLNKTSAVMHAYPFSGAANHIKEAAEKGEENIPCAVCLGAPPAVITASVMPAADTIDELAIAEALTEEKITAWQWNGLNIPAETEIVFTGRLSTTETAPEGPFANFTGGYSDVGYYPLFTLEKGYFRKGAVCPNILPAGAMGENCNLANIALRLMTGAVKKAVPEVLSINFPDFGIFGGVIFIRLRDVSNLKQTADRLSGIDFIRKYRCAMLFGMETDTENEYEALRIAAYNSLPLGGNFHDCTLKHMPPVRRRKI